MADSTLVASIMAALHALFDAVPTTDVNGGMAAIADKILGPLQGSGDVRFFSLGNGITIEVGKVSGAGTLTLDSGGSFANYSKTKTITYARTYTQVLAALAFVERQTNGSYGSFLSSYSVGTSSMGVRETSANNQAASYYHYIVIGLT